MLFVSMVIIVIIHTLNIYNGGNCYVSLVHILFITIIMIGLLKLRLKRVELVVKIWSGIGIAAGALGVLSICVLLLIGRESESISMTKLIIHIFHLVLGVIIYSNFNRSTMDL